MPSDSSFERATVNTLPGQIKSSQDELLRREFAHAKEYARLYEGSTPLANFFNERLHCVLDLIAPVRTGTILDLGCGPGMLLARLGGGQCHVFGLDRSFEMVTEAKGRTRGLSVNLTSGRLQQLPFRSASFDAIVVLGALEYIPDIQTALAEIARLAKPNAFIIISMLNKFSLYYLWERFIGTPWKMLQRLRGGTIRNSAPKLWLRGKKSLMKTIRACQLEPVDALYYGLNICVPPFDAKYPERASALNGWLEAHCRKPFSPLLHTGFVLKIRKPQGGQL